MHMIRIHPPCMAHTYYMINVTENELQEFVGQDASRVSESGKRVVGEDSSKPHGPTVEKGLQGQTAHAGMAMHDVDLLPDDNVAEYGEEGEDGRKRRRPVDDKERDVVDLHAVGEVANTLASGIFMCNHNDLVAPVDKLRRELVDVTFHASGLRKEKVANHSDVVRGGHLGGISHMSWVGTVRTVKVLELGEQSKAHESGEFWQYLLAPLYFFCGSSWNFFRSPPLRFGQ